MKRVYFGLESVMLFRVFTGTKFRGFFKQPQNLRNIINQTPLKNNIITKFLSFIYFYFFQSTLPTLLYFYSPGDHVIYTRKMILPSLIEFVEETTGIPLKDEL